MIRIKDLFKRQGKGKTELGNLELEAGNLGGGLGWKQGLEPMTGRQDRRPVSLRRVARMQERGAVSLRRATGREDRRAEQLCTMTWMLTT